MIKSQEYLDAMGIQTWVPRDAMAPEEEKFESTMPALGWDALEAQVADCKACPLHESRKQTVFGAGNQLADLVIIGEAPGAEEDRCGEPFVGRAGMLLDQMIASIGLSREEVYILNILKCRPPGNRDPQPHEVQCCTPFLLRQLELLQPKVLLAVGRIAAHFLLNCSTPLSHLRAKVYEYEPSGVPLLVTYHPAYLLRNPRDKRKSFEDLCKVNELLNGPN